MSPYIVTTTKRTRQLAQAARRSRDAGDIASPDGLGEPPVSHRAVATLDEARNIAFDLAEPGPRGERLHFHAALLLPESGGTIGPLPDGTTVEYWPLVGWHDPDGFFFAELVGEHVTGHTFGPYDRELTVAEQTAVYNTAQGQAA